LRFRTPSTASGRRPLTQDVASLEGLQVIYELDAAEGSGQLADLPGPGPEATAG